ncbi:LuxR C-terminal-related transcriptional regulator [Micromonospora sp. NPDC049903]|uniref:LuxR C-terminal-related transcriptional regulator n=1 Tax=Micromonospora sp. NPDC049903 TaxID=3364276 RepID=UPI0037A00817
MRVVAVSERPCPVWLVRAMTSAHDLVLGAALDDAYARGLLAETPGGVDFGPATSAAQVLGALSGTTRGLLHTRAAIMLATAAPTAAVRHATAALVLTGRIEPDVVDAFVASPSPEPGALADLLLAAERRAIAADVPQRRRWLLALADSLVLAGRGPQALRVLSAEIAADRDGGAYRSRLLGRLAELYAGQRPSVALACLRGALAHEGLDATSRVTLLAMVGALAARLGHPDTAALLRVAGSAHATGGNSASAAHLTLGRAAARSARGDLRGARDLLATLDPDAPALRREAAQIRVERIVSQLALGQYAEARAAIGHARADTLNAGLLGHGPVTALDCLRMVAIGELPEAAALAATTLDPRAPQVSQEVRALLVAVLAEVYYRRGEPGAARALLHDCLDDDREWPDRVMWTTVIGVAATDPASTARPRLLTGIVEDLRRSVHPLLPVPQFGPRLVRSALAGGDPDTARRVAELVAEVATQTPVPLWRALADQSRGLVARDAGALLAAVDGLRTTAARPALADALLDLAHGARVRRAQAWEAAREAAGLYGRIGAVGDQRTAERRADELATSRRVRVGRADERRRSGVDALTPAEARVAAMLAAGATKQQAAGSLFVSFHTVDTHVRSIYHKLGISSRLELVRVWDRHQPPKT